jgi:hypothetical protein
MNKKLERLMRLTKTPHQFVVAMYLRLEGVVWLQSTKNKVGDSVA